MHTFACVMQYSVYLSVTRVERKFKLARALSSRLEMGDLFRVAQVFRLLWLNFASEVIMVPTLPSPSYTSGALIT